jgi:hypothetical protein
MPQVDRYPFDVSKIVEHQDEMKDIIDADTAHLDAQTNAIADTVSTKNRVALITYSANKRRAAYNKMLIIIIAAVIVSICIYSVTSLLPIIPPILFGLIISIICSIALIWAYYIYIDVQSRSKINFDELATDIIHSNTISDEERANNLKSGNLLGSMNIGTCIGQGCCADDTLWNTNTTKCMAPCTSDGTVGGDWEGYSFDGATNVCTKDEAFTLIEGLQQSDKALQPSDKAINNTYLSKLQNMLLQTVESATKSAESATKSAENVNKSAENVNKSAENVNKSEENVNKSAENVNKSEENVNKTAKNVNTTNNNMSQVRSYANKSNLNVNKSNRALHHAIYSADQSRKYVDSAKYIVNTGKSNIDDMKSAIINAKSEITESTNEIQDYSNKIENAKQDIGKLALLLDDNKSVLDELNTSGSISELFTTLSYSNYK